MELQGALELEGWSILSGTGGRFCSVHGDGAQRVELRGALELEGGSALLRRWSHWTCPDGCCVEVSGDLSLSRSLAPPPPPSFWFTLSLFLPSSYPPPLPPSADLPHRMRLQCYEDVNDSLSLALYLSLSHTASKRG